MPTEQNPISDNPQKAEAWATALNEVSAALNDIANENPMPIRMRLALEDAIAIIVSDAIDHYIRITKPAAPEPDAPELGDGGVADNVARHNVRSIEESVEQLRKDTEAADRAEYPL